MFNQLSDEAWFAKLIRSQSDLSLGLPGFPSDAVQRTFVGQSGETALKEAFVFYQAVLRRLGAGVRETNLLDFGVGWGRIIRMFLRDTDPSRLYGVDVDTVILKTCADTKVPGTLLEVSPDGKLPFPDNFFGCSYSFSVFSHLSESGALHWLKELIRVTDNGGAVMFTTTDQRFLDLCHGCSLKLEGRNSYEDLYAKMFSDPVEAKARFKSGQHVYASVGGASGALKPESYGWAAIPQEWVERNCRGLVRVDSYILPPQFQQAVFTLTVTK